MGNLHRTRSERHTAAHITLASNVVQMQIAPSTPRSAPSHKTISCQAGSAIREEGAMEPLDSPKTDSYSGSLQSLVSSANVSNKNVVGQQALPNQSQHIDSQVISNFLSEILQEQEAKEQRKTEYSESKEDSGLHMTK